VFPLVEFSAMSIRLTKKQEEIVASPLDAKISLRGSAGTGKTTSPALKCLSLPKAKRLSAFGGCGI
jgi:hypothetical protein